MRILKIALMQIAPCGSLDGNLKKGLEYCEKAAAHFIELRAADKLPEPLDPEHRVAKFIGDYYTENRYIL